jgi:hypothetical protein
LYFRIPLFDTAPVGRACGHDGNSGGVALGSIGGGLETALFKLPQFFGAYVPDGVKVFHFLVEMLENGAFVLFHYLATARFGSHAWPAPVLPCCQNAPGETLQAAEG